MKKTLLYALAAMLLCTACQQNATNESADTVGPSQLDVELLKDSLDLSMDISQLSVSDLRILRNAPAARRGYPFRDSYLRSVFGATTWYDSLMWEFDDNEENFHFAENDFEGSYRDHYYNSIRSEAIAITPEEQDFINRVKTREEELLKNNFNATGDRIVNVGNIVNPGLLKTFDTELQHQLGRHGFAIVPAKHQQLFHVYEQNDYHQFPSFVTTDLYLQLFHLYFDAMLREVEENKLYKVLGEFCNELASTNRYGGDDNWMETFVRIPLHLVAGSTDPYNDTAKEECEKIMSGKDALSPFLGYNDANFAYSLFRPRGHYTRSDTLKRYFRTMMWLQTAPFQTDKKEDMRHAFWLANMIGSSPKLSKLYKTLTEPMDWLMGQPDDVTIMQLYDLLKATGKTVKELDDKTLASLTKKVDEIAEKQTRLRPKFQHTSRNKVRLMPQRYQPDAEVLQEMVDYKTTPSKRPVPTGLDVFAAMGVSMAEKILIEERNETKRWDGYKENMERMKQRMDSVNWNENVANVWLSALKEVAAPNSSKGGDNHIPYFMLTPQWGKKSLNAALASWAELKHDAILYAKQPMGAECGGAGPPDPVVKAYVEPNVKFWERAISLIESTETLFGTYGLATERSMTICTRIKEMAQFLLRMSNVELAGNYPTDEEYDQLKAIGAAFENMSLELIRNPQQILWEWDDVQGPERNVVLIADVYTANADNNPEKCILYEGVGQADEIYVIVEVQGYLYLMRGGVFSYRELTRPYDGQRMNDEEWQKKLETDPRLGVPSWMEEITVPLEEAPVDNEEVFYSSGC